MLTNNSNFTESADDKKIIENTLEGVIDETNPKDNTTNKQDHHHSALYAAKAVHSAVNHVKPRHSTHIDF